MFEKIRTWLIRRLGGVPRKQYEDCSEKMMYHASRADAAEMFRDNMKKFMGGGIVRIESDMNVLCVKTAVSMDIPEPTQDLKRAACRKLVDALLDKKIISFDVMDDRFSRIKLYSAQIAVVCPREYISRMYD